MTYFSCMDKIYKKSLFFYLLLYSSNDLKIESASLVPVDINFASTLNCSLQAMLSVGCG